MHEASVPAIRHHARHLHAVRRAADHSANIGYMPAFAGTSLAQLQRNQNHIDEARQLLASGHGRFIEGVRDRPSAIREAAAGRIGST
jgi:hypothetical protein